MSFLLFIFLLFAIFVLVPVFKIGMQIYQARKRLRDMYRSMSGSDNYGRQTSQAYGRTQTSAQPRKKKKKIDPSVGEYVAFEEISVSETETHSSTDNGKKASYTVEQQIEDAVWEEIR